MLGHALVGEAFASDNVLDGGGESLFGGDIAGGARDVGEGGAGEGCGADAGLRRRCDPEIAGEFTFALEVAVESGAGGLRRLKEIDGHAAAVFAGFKFLLEIGGEGGVGGDDGYMRGGFGA